MEFQKVQRELEHLTKLYIAFKFVSAEETAAKVQDDLEEIVQKLEEIRKNIIGTLYFVLSVYNFHSYFIVNKLDGEQEIQRIQSRIEELQRRRSEELGCKLEQMEEDLASKEKNAVKTDSSLKAVKDNMKQEEKKKNQIHKGMTSVRNLCD